MGAKSSVCPSKPGKANFFGRDIPGFSWDMPAVPEKFERKKKFVQVLAPKGSTMPMATDGHRRELIKQRVGGAKDSF